MKPKCESLQTFIENHSQNRILQIVKDVPLNEPNKDLLLQLYEYCKTLISFSNF